MACIYTAKGNEGLYLINSLNIEDIYKSIKQKGANVSLIISDCCNTVPGTSSNITGSIASARSSSLGWSLTNCAQLFLPTAPVAILITAAAKGEMSAGNNNFGGFFIYNFRTPLTNSLSHVHGFTGVSWPQIITEAQTQTIKKQIIHYVIQMAPKQGVLNLLYIYCSDKLV